MSWINVREYSFISELMIQAVSLESLYFTQMFFSVFRR